MVDRNPKREPWSLSQRLWVILACLWIISASLGPDIQLGEGLLKLRPEDFLTLIMGGIALLMLLNSDVRWSTLGIMNRVALFACGLGIIALVALSLQTLSGTSLSASATEGTFGYGRQQEVFKEIIRFAKYVLVAYAFSQASSRAWKPFLGVLAISCVILISIQILQYLEIPGVNDWILVTYARGEEVNLSYAFGVYKEYSTWRSGSLMLNPNVLGAYLVAPFFLFLMLLLESLNATLKEVRRVRLLWLGMSGIIWLGIFLTQGRTILIAILFGAIVSILHIPRRFRRKLNRIVAWAIVAAVITSVAFASTTYRYSAEGLSRGFGEDSFGHKMGSTLAAVQELGSLIVVGAGPAGARFVDNELGYIITWYGLLGLFVYFLFYWSLYRLILDRIQNIYIRTAFLGTLAAYLLGGVSSSFLLNNRVFPVFIALLTLACAQTNQRSVYPFSVAQK